jgi:hypothetical protein
MTRAQAEKAQRSVPSAPDMRRRSPIPAPPEANRQQQILVILRGAATCTPPSPAEVKLTMQGGVDAAPTHFTTTLLLHCAGVEGGIADFRAIPELQSRLRKIQSRRGTHTEKTRWREHITRQLERHQPGADQYQTAFTAVGVCATAFETHYVAEGGRLNREALSKLYDDTDILEHPAVAAAQTVQSSGDERVRTAGLQCERFIRFLLDQAFRGEAQVQ